MVVLGHINYLNCIPVHGAILSGNIPFDGKIVRGNPAQLNLMLKKGEVDISPSSSVELVNGYKVLHSLSISGREDVKSIILLTRIPIEEISNGVFYVTSHSATSSMLLKVILNDFFSVSAKYETFDPDKISLDGLGKSADGVLYIGDYALRLEQAISPFKYRYDLATLWYQQTGYPFSFALWQVSPASEKKPGIKAAVKTLYESYSFYKDNTKSLADIFSGQFGMSPEDILEYWTHLSFDFETKHMESLKLFFAV
jgi:chorismate dehydratase